VDLVREHLAVSRSTPSTGRSRNMRVRTRTTAMHLEPQAGILQIFT
jgi:hypothetical protein